MHVDGRDGRYGRGRMTCESDDIRWEDKDGMALR